MAPPPPPFLSRLLLTLLLLPPSTHPQQIGSFFTAIYLNGAPIASNQSPCSGMGQSQYCCPAGQSCAWDDAGHVACCAAGSTCSGSPYSSGAAAGAYTQPSSWQPSSSSAYVVTPITTTVYTQGQTACDCETTTPSENGGGGVVVPIVPITKATLATSYYSVPTSTYYPSSSGGMTTTTTVPGQGQGQGQVTTIMPGVVGVGVSTTGPVACATVSTITEANVGQPVRTVGCLIIFNASGKSYDVDGAMVLMGVGLLGLVAAFLV